MFKDGGHQAGACQAWLLVLILMWTWLGVGQGVAAGNLRSQGEVPTAWATESLGASRGPQPAQEPQHEQEQDQSHDQSQEQEQASDAAGGADVSNDDVSDESLGDTETASDPTAEPEDETAEQQAGDSNAGLKGDWLSGLQWRSIGPASMGGRIVDLEVDPKDPFTFYVATASGGLFKTVNNGNTFTSIFENESSVSIGDIAVSASHPDIIWVGTGEHNARNSVSWGDGVYRSTDGGSTWQNRGLEKSFQIGRIAIHPTDPNVVYVGALGRLWGPNPERGVYKTTDGGETWEKILHVDDDTGCIEVQMHPQDPDTLLVAMYQRRRDRYNGGDPAQRWGPGSGIFKTTDGGQNWRKITEGLPDRPLGRIGISYYQSNPDIVYAIVESDYNGRGPSVALMGIGGGRSEQGAVLTEITADGPAAAAGLQPEDRIVELDGQQIESYEQLTATVREKLAGDNSQLVVQRGDDTLELEIVWGERSSRGSTPRPFVGLQNGQQANIQDQQGPQGFQTGGVFRSEDGGESWRRVNSLNPRPFYYSQIRVDPSNDRNVYVLGISFHYSTNRGRTFRTGGSRVHPDHHALWINPRDGRHLILGCDGGLYTSHDRGQRWDFVDIMDIGQFYDVGVDPRRSYWVYGGLQDNGSWGGPSRKRGATGPQNSDWVRIGGGDGFVCRVDPQDPDWVYYESQNGRIGRLNVKTAQRVNIRPVAEQGLSYRFNWKTPFQLSNHNSKIFYTAGNYVFRSLHMGDNLRRISPRITATNRGSATALSESPMDADVLYVGTDDGLVWVTRDGGTEWQDVTENIPLPGSFHVSSIEASRFGAGRAYVAFDGHRSDNDDPHLYVTEDYGATWEVLSQGLPPGSTHCLREDVANENLLYCGTEFGIWVSLDRGRYWRRLNNNLPTVAVHEVAVHPVVNEVVAATHGRSLWILDVTPLRQWSEQVAEASAYLFQPDTGVLWAGALASNRSGHRHFVGTNPSFGSPLYYYLGQEANQVSLEVVDVQGQVVRSFRSETSPGLHRAHWDLRRGPTRRSGSRQATAGAAVGPGTYQVRLTVDGQTYRQPIQVEGDPLLVAGPLQAELEELEAERREMAETTAEQ